LNKKQKNQKKLKQDKIIIETPTEQLIEMLGNPSLSKSEIKQIKRELHRRKSKGEKFSIPSITEKDSREEKSAEKEGVIKCWMTSHILGYPGQIIGFGVLKEGYVRVVIIHYSLEPKKYFYGFYLENITFNECKALFETLSSRTYAQMAQISTSFCLKRIKNILTEIDETQREWNNDATTAIKLIEDCYKSYVELSQDEEVLEKILPSPEIKARIFSDSSSLRKARIFRDWVPPKNESKAIIERVNSVVKGVIISDYETKKQSMKVIIDSAVDSYFDSTRRKSVADSLIENAYIAKICRDMVFAQECSALAELIMDFSIPSREIGFLVECMKGDIVVRKEKDALFVLQKESGLVVPGPSLFSFQNEYGENWDEELFDEEFEDDDEYEDEEEDEEQGKLIIP